MKKPAAACVNASERYAAGTPVHVGPEMRIGVGPDRWGAAFGHGEQPARWGGSIGRGDRQIGLTPSTTGVDHGQCGEHRSLHGDHQLDCPSGSNLTFESRLGFPT